MIRIALVACVLCVVTAANADAQMLGRLFGRGNCSSGSCSSSGYSSTGTASAGSCTSGVCAAPVSQEQGFVAVPQANPTATQVAASNRGMTYEISTARGRTGAKSLVAAYYADALAGKRKSSGNANPIQIARR